MKRVAILAALGAAMTMAVPVASVAGPADCVSAYVAAMTAATAQRPPNAAAVSAAQAELRACLSG